MAVTGREMARTEISFGNRNLKSKGTPSIVLHETFTSIPHEINFKIQSKYLEIFFFLNKFSRVAYTIST